MITVQYLIKFHESLKNDTIDTFESNCSNDKRQRGKRTCVSIFFSPNYLHT